MWQLFKPPIKRLAQTEDAASCVLEAERVALAGVEQCRRQALRRVVTSWLRAWLVHKRTEARIERLRGRMTAAAQDRQQQINGELQILAGDTGTDVFNLALRDSVLDRVTEELAGIPESD